MSCDRGATAFGVSASASGGASVCDRRAVSLRPAPAASPNRKAPAVRARALATAAALVIGAAACEPSGPGALTATVQTPGPTGAVVVELVGRDLSGFEGVGDVRTFAAAPLPTDSIRRVIVMSPSAGPLQFRVQVPDVSAPPPAAIVVDAVDAGNRKLTTLTGYTVRISR